MNSGIIQQTTTINMRPTHTDTMIPAAPATAKKTVVAIPDYTAPTSTLKSTRRVQASNSSSRLDMEGSRRRRADRRSNRRRQRSQDEDLEPPSLRTATLLQMKPLKGILKSSTSTDSLEPLGLNRNRSAPSLANELGGSKSKKVSFPSLASRWESNGSGLDLQALASVAAKRNEASSGKVNFSWDSQKKSQGGSSKSQPDSIMHLLELEKDKSKKTEEIIRKLQKFQAPLKPSRQGSDTHITHGEAKKSLKAPSKPNRRASVEHNPFSQGLKDFQSSTPISKPHRRPSLEKNPFAQGLKDFQSSTIVMAGMS